MSSFMGIYWPNTSIHLIRPPTEANRKEPKTASFATGGGQIDLDQLERQEQELRKRAAVYRHWKPAVMPIGLSQFQSAAANAATSSSAPASPAAVSANRNHVRNTRMTSARVVVDTSMVSVGQRTLPHPDDSDTGEDDDDDSAFLNEHDQILEQDDEEDMMLSSTSEPEELSSSIL